MLMKLEEGSNGNGGGMRVEDGGNVLSQEQVWISEGRIEQ